MKSVELGCFRLCYWSLWKAIEEEGVHLLGFMAFGLVV